MLAYHSVQLSYTWLDFNCFLGVMISEIRILCHFILVLLSSTLMKQLTCNVGIISLIRIRIRIICSQFITFDEVTLYSVYCTWFVAFLATPYAVFLRGCPYLFLAQFDSSVYISLSCTDLCKLSTEGSDHFIDGWFYC